MIPYIIILIHSEIWDPQEQNILVEDEYWGIVPSIGILPTSAVASSKHTEQTVKEFSGLGSSWSGPQTKAIIFCMSWLSPQEMVGEAAHNADVWESGTDEALPPAETKDLGESLALVLHIFSLCNFLYKHFASRVLFHSNFNHFNVWASF